MNNFFKNSFLRSVIFLVFFASLDLITASSTKAATFTYKATNNLQQAVTDLEIFYRGTGGLLSNPMIVNSDVPTTINLFSSNSGVQLFFTPNQLQPGQMVTFKFDSFFNKLQIDRAFWTVNGTSVGDARNDISVPEPSSVISLLALVGTLGAASTFKHQLKPSKSSQKETAKVG